jgi:hypothetical protein
MVTLVFEDRCRILLARFSGIHVPEDISELDWAISKTIAWEGAIQGLLLDYTVVEAVAVPETFIAQWARLPQISPDYERVMVVPAPEPYRLARTYSTLQCEFGIKQPRVALSLLEAYELLNLEQPNFRPIGY